MQKIACIFIILSFTSCSVFKQLNSGDNLVLETNDYSDNVVESIGKFNISNQNFFIRKAEIQIISAEEKQNFLASIKFLFPDKYLISLRNRTGVEGARVFLTGDTILINDRISRELLYGEPDYIRNKFGISLSALPLVFGDFVFNNLEDGKNVKCINGFIKLNSSIAGLRYEFVIDCKALKLFSCKQINEREEGQVILNYSRYIEIGNHTVPARIELLYGNIQVLISIKNIEIPWVGELDFMPGRKYDVIPLK